MLGFIITLAVIGAILGLVFSRRGNESQGFFRGAKKGATLGCLLCLIFIALVAAAVIFLLSAGGTDGSSLFQTT